jgi:argininosuccinate synthase
LKKKSLIFKHLTRIKIHEKVLLAFSGGLDTSYCAKYLSEIKGFEVHSALVNTGGFSKDELNKTEETAYRLGVKKSCSY